MSMGTVEVNKDLAKQCAENYIKYWNAREEKNKQKYIDYEMNRRWPFRAKTIEEALKRQECVFGGYNFTYGTQWRDKAKTIVVAAQLSAKDTFILDMEVVEWLSDYQNEVIL